MGPRRHRNGVARRAGRIETVARQRTGPRSRSPGLQTSQDRRNIGTRSSVYEVRYHRSDRTVLRRRRACSAPHQCITNVGACQTDCRCRTRHSRPSVRSKRRSQVRCEPRPHWYSSRRCLPGSGKRHLSRLANEIQPFRRGAVLDAELWYAVVEWRIAHGQPVARSRQGSLPLIRWPADCGKRLPTHPADLRRGPAAAPLSRPPGRVRVRQPAALLPGREPAGGGGAGRVRGAGRVQR